MCIYIYLTNNIVCNYETDFQFSNGCYAPPWRQVHGDISYFDVKPLDGDILHITASTSGFFLNKGKTPEGDINYEREGNIYPTLATLLKEKSAHFASTIEKKVSPFSVLLGIWEKF